MSVTVALAVAPDQPFSFQEVELGPLRDDEVRVRITASGICHTDVAVKEQSVELPLPSLTRSETLSRDSFFEATPQPRQQNYCHADSGNCSSY